MKYNSNTIDKQIRSNNVQDTRIACVKVGATFEFLIISIQYKVRHFISNLLQYFETFVIISSFNQIILKKCKHIKELHSKFECIFTKILCNCACSAICGKRMTYFESIWLLVCVTSMYCIGVMCKCNAKSHTLKRMECEITIIFAEFYFFVHS